MIQAMSHALNVRFREMSGYQPVLCGIASYYARLAWHVPGEGMNSEEVC